MDVKFLESFVTQQDINDISQLKAENLVILLHGYGSSGEDIMSIQTYLKKNFSEAIFIAPNAFEKIPDYPEGYQWFDISNLETGKLQSVLHQASDKLKEFCENQLDRLNLKWNKLILLGFSQGAIMALDLALKNDNKLAGILSISGGYDANLIDQDKDYTKQNICFIHGTDDDVLPCSWSELAHENLVDKVGYSEINLLENCGHHINPEGIEKMTEFLQKIASK